MGFAAAWGLFCTLAGAGGCSNSSECESSRCAAGNACIDDGTGSGTTCHLLCTAQSDCPYGYYCNDGQLGSQGKNWCAPNTNYPPANPDEDQWSKACPASGGEKNAACDYANFFACYGTSPTDATSFCTEFGCSQDSDCKGGWWCSTQNVGPNVVSANETFGQTRTLCLPRWYCAPCKLDHDCSAAQDGSPQHCVPDSNGNGYCTPECSSTADCTLDATCVAPWDVCGPASGEACMTDDDCPPASGTFQHCEGGKCSPECGSNADCPTGETCKPQSYSVCRPRAGVCVGSGGFCSPCRSDADCTTGFCATAGLSTERFCTAKASVAACDSSLTDPPGCPVPTASDNWKSVMCTSGGDPAAADQCVAFVTVGAGTSEAQAVPGCWSANR
jgi:hypothetical protein